MSEESSSYEHTTALNGGQQILPLFAPFNPDFKRKGTWSQQEEVYASKLIEAFNNGLLDLEEGTSLRLFLAKKLYWYQRKINFIWRSNTFYPQ